MVPIVPIVIRNAGEIMWRNAKVAQEGTIEVAVHEPVPTAGWTKADLDEWVMRMRQLYIATLDDWPGIEAGEKWSAAIAAFGRPADFSKVIVDTTVQPKAVAHPTDLAPPWSRSGEFGLWLA